MASKSIANLGVSITARTRGLRKGLQRAKKQIAAFGADVVKVGKRVTLLAGLITGLGAAGTVAGLSKAFGAISNLAKISRKLDIAPNALTALRDAATDAEIPISAVDTGLQRMVRRISEAGKGKGEAVGALQELGLNARMLAKMDPAEQFTEIADAIKKFPRGDQIRLAMRLFDTEGVALIEVMDKLREAGGRKGAAGGLKSFVDNVLETGRGVDERANFVESILDRFTQFGRRFAGIFFRLAQQIAPSIDRVLGLIEQFMSRGDVNFAIAKTVRAVGDAIVRAAKFMSDFLRQASTWKAMGQAVKGYLQWLGQVRTDLGDLVEWVKRTINAIDTLWKRMTMGAQRFVDGIRSAVNEVLALYERLRTIAGIGGGGLAAARPRLGPAKQALEQGDVSGAHTAYQRAMQDSGRQTGEIVAASLNAIVGALKAQDRAVQDNAAQTQIDRIGDSIVEAIRRGFTGAGGAAPERLVVEVQR